MTENKPRRLNEVVPPLAPQGSNDRRWFMIEHLLMDAKNDVQIACDYFSDIITQPESEEEREAAEQRALEMNAFLAPVRDQVAVLSENVNKLAENMTPKEGPKSEELKAIEVLAGEIKVAVSKIGTGGGEGSSADQLANTLDSIGVLLEKMEGVYGKFRGEGGGDDFDWRAAGISTIGEVTKEALATYKETHKNVPWAGEPGEKERGEEQEQLSKRLVERRVYNYAMSEIQKGTLQLDPYAAGKALNLTPNQVWWAIDNLKKRGLLAAGPASAETTEPETKELEVPLGPDGKPLVEGL